jgi:hypothetical protein
MATQTAVQIQLDQLGQQFYLEPFTYRTQMTIPSAYGNVTENLLIGADADFFVTGVSATITDKRGVVQLEDAYRDQFKVNITNNNTGKRYMNTGVELSEFVDSINSVEFRGYVWKIQSQLQFTVEHTNFVQFKRPDLSYVSPTSDIELHYGRVKVTTNYESICAQSTIMNELWTADGASVLTGQTQEYLSNQSPYMPVQIGLSFNGVKLFAKAV